MKHFSLRGVRAACFGVLIVPVMAVSSASALTLAADDTMIFGGSSFFSPTASFPDPVTWSFSGTTLVATGGTGGVAPALGNFAPWQGNGVTFATITMDLVSGPSGGQATYVGSIGSQPLLDFGAGAGGAGSLTFNLLSAPFVRIESTSTQTITDTVIFGVFLLDGSPVANFGGNLSLASTVPGLGGAGTLSASLTTTAIPLPAALPLFVTAMGGLGAVGAWRRRRAAKRAA